jgi:hypothetical protein
MKYLLAVAAALSLFISCKKENKNSTNALIESSSTIRERFDKASKFLSREVSWNYASPLFKYVRTFSYDANSRVTQIKIGTIDSSSISPVFTLSRILTFHYSGSENVPSTVSSVRMVFPNLVTEYYFQYNSDGLKARDSVRVKNILGEPADRVTNYVYDKDKIYSTPFANGFTLDNAGFDTIDFKAGNIEMLSHTYKFGTEAKVKYSFSYDHNINPFNRMNIATGLYFQNSALGIGYNVPLETHYIGLNANNIRTWTSDSDTFTYTYLYDKDRYPIRKTMFLPGNTNPEQVTAFEYK